MIILFSRLDEGRKVWFGYAMSYSNTKKRVTLISLSLVLLLFSCAEESELERTIRLAYDGDAMAQFVLGMMYYNGLGVPKDFKQAYVWIYNAKMNYHESATGKLDIITEEMTKKQIADAKSLATEIHNRIIHNRFKANRKD